MGILSSETDKAHKGVLSPVHAVFSSYPKKEAGMPRRVPKITDGYRNWWLCKDSPVTAVSCRVPAVESSSGRSRLFSLVMLERARILGPGRDRLSLGN